MMEEQRKKELKKKKHVAHVGMLTRVCKGVSNSSSQT